MSHGYISPNPNGMRARCGGPGMCIACKQEFMRKYDRPYTHKDAEMIQEIVSKDIAFWTLVRDGLPQEEARAIVEAEALQAAKDADQVPNA